MYSPTDNYTNHLDHFVRQMPGFVAWKTPGSTYASANLLCAKLAGYNSIDQYIGTKSHDWKCEAVNFADKIDAQDKWVLENKKTWNSLNILNFADSITCYLSQKSILTHPNGQTLGIFFSGTIIENSNIIGALTSLLQDDIFKDKSGAKCGIYSISNFHQQIELSLRQEECLFYLLRGKSAKEIATLLNISCRTVETYLVHIKDKFQCRTCSELIVKAMQLGYYYYLPPSLIHNLKLV